MEMINWSLFFASLLPTIFADYECFCNYREETSVYAAPQVDDGAEIGKLYEFDCKPTYHLDTVLNNWQAIQFEKKVGYVKIEEQTKMQTCPGTADPVDTVIEQSTTQSPGHSTEVVVTLNQSTRRSTFSSVLTTIKATQTSLTYTNPTTKHTSIPTSSILTTTKAKSTTPKTTSITTKATSSTVTTTTTTKRPLQCPPQVPRSRNLMEFANHCYEFILGVHRKWPDAELDCNQKGGHLVSIGSSAEQRFLYQSLGELHFHGDRGIWIGLTDQDVEGQWRWSSGEAIIFNHWATNEPGPLGSFKDCALMDMRYNGSWVDFSCSGFLFNPGRHGYVCEYNKIQID